MFSAPSVERATLSPLCCLHTIKINVLFFVGLFMDSILFHQLFCIFYGTKCCFDFCSFVISLETRQCQPSNFQSCFCSPRYFQCPYEFQNQFVNFYTHTQSVLILIITILNLQINRQIIDILLNLQINRQIIDLAKYILIYFLKCSLIPLRNILQF